MATSNPPREFQSSLSEVASDDEPAKSRRGRRLRRLLTDRLSIVGLLIVTTMLGLALAAPWIAPHDPAEQNVMNRLSEVSGTHPLGTDHLGRDVLSRLLFGARWSLGIAASASVIVMVIGVTAGIVAGYYGRFIDAALMRLVDVLLAFPDIVLVLAVVGTLGGGAQNLLLALVAFSWVGYARVVRGLVLSIREREFVLASRGLGGTDLRIMLRHVLPNVVSPVMVLVSLRTGGVILAVAALGFFGIGVSPPTPEWGTMLNQARPFISTAPQLLFYPGAAITVAVLGFNLLGDGLRDVLDPHTNF